MDYKIGIILVLVGLFLTPLTLGYLTEGGNISLNNKSKSVAASTYQDTYTIPESHNLPSNYEIDNKFNELLVECDYNEYVAMVLYVNNETAGQYFLDKFSYLGIGDMSKSEVINLLEDIGYSNTKNIVKKMK